MAEKRKPKLVILLRFQGKKNAKKVELFNSMLWDKGIFPYTKTEQYRIRVNGKWFNDKNNNMIFYKKTTFKNLLFKSIKL